MAFQIDKITSANKVTDPVFTELTDGTNALGTASNPINATLVTGDIEIGAVEIKNATTDDRVKVTAANTARVVGDMVLSVQEIGADGTVKPTGSLVSNSPFTKVTDGTNTLDVVTQDGAFGTATKGLAVFGKYQATPTTYSDGDATPVLLDANGRIVLSSDIQIGAVELKNGADDTRATINAANTARTNATTTLVTQPIDAAGNVLGTTAANTARTTSTLVNPVEIIDAAGNVVNVTAANTARTTGTLVLPTQSIDASGKVFIAGDTTSNSPFVKIGDGTTAASVTTGTIKGINAVISDGTTIPAVLTGTTKTLATSLHDGTTLVTFGTDTIKTVPSKLSDGTTTVGVIVSTNALKTDLSSVAGTATAVNVGAASAGTARVALSRDARGNSIQADYESPQDFTVAFTSSTTATCSGAPFTVDDANCTVLYLQIKPTGSTWGARYLNGQDGVSLIASSNIITIAGAGTPLASGDAYRVGLSSQKKSYIQSTNSDSITESSPLSLQIIPDSLVDTTNVAASQQYYPSSLGMSMDGYKNFSLTGKYIDGDATTTTIIVQAMNDEDQTNGDWITIQGQIQGLTGTVTGTVAGAAGVALNPGSVTASIVTASAQTITFAWDFDNLNYRFIRVGVLPGDATNTTIIKARRSY